MKWTQTAPKIPGKYLRRFWKSKNFEVLDIGMNFYKTALAYWDWEEHCSIARPHQIDVKDGKDWWYGPIPIPPVD